MARTLFWQAMVWDGSGAIPFPGDLLVDGDRIRAVARKTGEGDGAGRAGFARQQVNYVIAAMYGF
jgi:hypothetical protein